MRYLITGGCGFIGTNLSDYFLSRGDEVTVFDNLSRNGVKHNLEWLKGRHKKNLKFILGDVRKDTKKLDDAVKGVDAVYHTAAQVAVTTSVSDPLMDFQVNVFGTLNVLEAVRKSNGDPAFIFTSTNKVYGGMDDIEIEEAGDRYDYKTLKTGNPETTPLDFHSPYGCSKGAA
ncbi:MAG: GDP-mannose 4,6-dehydratase, partial [Candidatus Altiarchaeota archaeon]|nr:GDP-mannose 4,6-dehydratase [Candidatus Altiarchaeota archaeon]